MYYSSKSVNVSFQHFSTNWLCLQMMSTTSHQWHYFFLSSFKLRRKEMTLIWPCCLIKLDYIYIFTCWWCLFDFENVMHFWEDCFLNKTMYLFSAKICLYFYCTSYLCCVSVFDIFWWNGLDSSYVLIF